jgi:hypothetical protein
MLIGTLSGIWAFFSIGFYVAALVSAIVSMLIILISMWLIPDDFKWSQLNETSHQLSKERSS